MWLPPLLLVPLVIYNLAAFGWLGSGLVSWTAPVMSLDLVSGATWSLTSGDLLLLLALVLLFIEVLKATRTGALSIVDHGLSAVVFVIYLVEFLVVPAAATSLFFACTAMSFIDLVAGFAVSIRAAGPDVNFS
jgi:hypothetical protein